MKKILFIILFFITIPLGKSWAQSKLSFGIGGGPNYFYDWEEGNIGYSIYLDGRYAITDAVFASLSYNYNHLNASHPDETGTKTSYYFETDAHDIELHFSFDIVQLTTQSNSPLKIMLDIGAGYSFFNEGLYYGDASANDGQLYNRYIEDIREQGWGNAAKSHLGGEILYDFNNFSIFFNLFGNYYFSSEIDGKAYYYKTVSGSREKTDCFNDITVTSAIGLRINADALSFNGGSKSSGNKKTTTSFIKRHPRWSNKKNIKNWKAPQAPTKRYQGRKDIYKQWKKRNKRKKRR